MNAENQPDMNNTDPNIHLQAAARKNMQLREALERTRGAIVSTIERLRSRIDELQAAVDVEYTGWLALFRRTEDGEWECVRVLDGDNPPDDIEEDWELSLPIPKPETLPEFTGW